MGQRRRTAVPKPAGQASGLGLSLVYGLAARQRGAVTLDSKPGEGTTVTVYLPAAQAASATEPASAPPRVRPSAGRTVLLVDDDEPILRAGTRMLEALDYEVVRARDGLEAIRVCRQRRGDVLLVVLDLVMPVMDGTESFRQMIREYPDLKVLLSSGHAPEGEVAELLEQGAAGFIQKPYTFKALTDEIGRLVD